MSDAFEPQLGDFTWQCARKLVIPLGVTLPFPPALPNSCDQANRPGDRNVGVDLRGAAAAG